MINNRFEPLDNDEVLYVNIGRVLMPNPTFKVGEFLDALAQAVSDREPDWSDANEGWFAEGLRCEVLRFSTQGWQRGRVRLRLEFCPDEERPKLLDSRDNRREEVRRPDRPEPRYDDAYRPEKSVPRYDNPYDIPEDDY